MTIMNYESKNKVGGQKHELDFGYLFSVLEIHLGKIRNKTQMKT